MSPQKLRYPESEETLTSGRVVIPNDDEHRATNALDAFAKGAWLGLKIAGMILSTLLCIIALLGLAGTCFRSFSAFSKHLLEASRHDARAIARKMSQNSTLAREWKG